MSITVRDGFAILQQIPEVIPLFGACVTAGAWCLRHIKERYLYSGDIDILREYYPIIKSSAEFFCAYLVRDPRNGYLVTSPASSPENYFISPEDGKTVNISAGPTADIAVIKELFQFAADTADLLGTDAEFAAELREKYVELPPYQIGKYGQLMEWLEDFEEWEPGHRHTAHLYALHPSDQIKKSTPELFEAARKTVERRLANGGGHTGWSRAWIVNFYARLGDGNAAYVCYFRSHQPRTQLSPDRENKFRSISVIYSNDFKNWTEPKALEYDDDIECDLYTNSIIQYERAPHMIIGFPARYFDHYTGWSDNMEQMISGGHKKRAAEMSEIRRVGLAITDSIFMCSRDGELWHRYHSAFVDPGYENETNWVYGSNFLAYNFIDSGRENYYFYDIEGSRDYYNPRYLRRYEIRKDGFACIMADGGTMLSDGEKVVVTKPIVFDSNGLHINFSTSAFGYIYVDVLDEDGNPLSDKQSVKLFGSNIGRVVRINDGSDFTEYKGKAIRLRFRMLDAKLFSMKFE